MKSKKLLCALHILILICFAQLVFAQTKTISGTVSDEKNVPIPNVSVTVRGTTVGTVTDENGNYSISVRSSDALLFSAVGYKSMGIAVGGGSVINITLIQDVTGLTDVVVIGYGTARKKDLTGAVSVVNVDDMKKQPTANVVEQLQGRASGITVIPSGQPGESPSIKIRGVNTFGDNTPMYVVDGVPTFDINSVNPADIESLQVLKDAGSASIYGSRASNGVIIITTKRGKGRVNVSYDAYYGMQYVKRGNVYDLLNPQEMANLKWLALKNTPGLFPTNDPLYGNGQTPVLPEYIIAGNVNGLAVTPTDADPKKYYINPNYTSGDDFGNFYRIVKANKAGTDWFHEIMKDAPITNHNISMSAGNDQGSYLFSVNYFNQQGNQLYQYYKRLSTRLNTTYNVSQKIRVGENLAVTYNRNPRQGNNNEGTPLSMAYRQQPIIPVYDIMGNYAGTYGGKLGNATNPVAAMWRGRNNTDYGLRILGNIYAEVDLLTDLTVRTSFGGSYSYWNGNWFTYPTYENAENGQSNTYGEWWGTSYDWTWTNTATYQKKVNLHNFKLVAGTEAYSNRGRGLNLSRQGYFSFDPNYTDLKTGSSNASFDADGTWRDYSKLMSYFGRFDYTFNDKYLFSVTGRRDGSSKFLNYPWGNFWSVSAGWRLSQEEFMKSLTWLTDMKIRGSYGIMGNQMNAGSRNSYTTFSSVMNNSWYDIGGSGNNLIQGFYKNFIGNPDGKWENDVNANIGFDATIKNGLLDITAEYYRKDIKDLLFGAQLPATAGSADRPAVNMAKMKNDGFDFRIGSTINATKDLTLKADLTLTTYRNKIIKISDGGTEFFGWDSWSRNGNGIINRVGDAVSSFYGYRVVGFWNTQAEIDAANAQAVKAGAEYYQKDMGLGRFKYDDLGKGFVSPESRVVLGSPNPDFSYGLNLGLNYKQFDFSAFFYGVQGAELFNQVRWWTDFYGDFAGAKSKTALYNSWLPDRKNAKAPIQENTTNFSTSDVPSSYFVENASFMKLKNIQIGYALPINLLQRVHINRMRIYVQGANLFTVTKYTGLDPEVGGSTTSVGRAEGAIPLPRQLIIGANINF